MAVSPYWRNGALARAEDGSWRFAGMQRFLSSLLADTEVSLPPAGVVDVGIIEQSGWAVIEANPCWGAGLYGCSPMAVLNTIRRAIRVRSQLAADDLPWVGIRNRKLS